MSRKLIVNDGRRQRELLLVGKIVVGRDPTCDLSEADPLLSRRHAEFAISGDDIIVRDLGSRNGIYLNGARVAEGTLQSGDVVRIGPLQMRYVEDSSPLVAVPELIDDATGLVLTGPRTPATPTPPQPAAMRKPPAPPLARQRPAPAPPGEKDVDVTAYISPSAIRRALAAPSSEAGSPQAAPSEDEAVQTRVVPAPGRTGLRSPIHTAAQAQAAPPLNTAVQPPPVPMQDELASDMDAVRGTALVPPPGTQTAVQPPPSEAAMHTAVQPPPSPPAADTNEPTSVVLAPRPRTRVEAPARSSTADDARQARALAMAVEAIATFLGSSSISQNAADAIKTLERDLAGTRPPADLVAALKGLVARLGAAANELT